MPVRRRRPGQHEQGAPDGLTEDTHELIVQAIRNGAYLVHAAGFAGIHPETLRRWVRNGEGPEPERAAYSSAHQHRKARNFHRRCTELCGAIERAEAHFVLAQLQLIRELALERRNWRAAAWLLERRFPDLFSLRTEVTGADGGPIEVVDPAADLERLERVLEEYAERAQG